MRELTLDELYDVAGGLQQSSGDDGGGGGDGGDTGGGSGGTGSGGGSTTTNNSVAAYASVAATLQIFFDDMTNAALDYQSAHTGADQASHYNDGSDTAPMDPGSFFMQDFGQYLSASQYEAMGGGFYDFLTEGIDPEFILATAGDSSSTINFSGGTAVLTSIDGTHTNFSLGGANLVASWHSFTSTGAAGDIQPDDIVVTGQAGYWTFTTSGNSFGDMSQYSPQGGGGGQPTDTEFHGLSGTGESNAPYAGQPHMAEGETRHLTQAEKIAAAGYTNLTDAELDAVVIRSGGQFGSAAATTYPWSINMAANYALKDYSNNADTMDLLIHELYHVYQYDSGFTYSRMIADEAVVAVSSHNYYTYTSSDLAAIAQNPSNLAAFNIETQAAIAQDYYRVSHGLPTQGAVGFSPTAQDLKSAIHF